MAPSSILWQNDRKTVVLLDLPRSIEEAQVPSSQLTGADGQSRRKLRRLISALPPASPFPTPEPKAGDGFQLAPTSASAQVAELMTLAAVESALEELKASYTGPWCLPRICSQPATANPRGNPHNHPPDDPPNHNHNHHLPPTSHPLAGTIQSHRATFLSTTPAQGFDLMVLDPPWPNRSAKRKRAGYQPAADLSALRALLRQIPVAARLAPGGLVAVWVTNAARCAELLTAGGGGIFAEWDVELVGEWVWLKVTSAGEPVVGVDSAWRKPWERLLLARKRGGGGGGHGGLNGAGKRSVEGKVVVAVPAVHSCKPNLRALFEELLPERYEALEVFARSLTAGWWAWGDEVLLFQRRECWVEAETSEEECGDVGTGNRA